VHERKGEVKKVMWREQPGVSSLLPDAGTATAGPVLSDRLRRRIPSMMEALAELRKRLSMSISGA
jgi:hypothetical protein